MTGRKSGQPKSTVPGPLTCVDLFAGAGGFSLAAIRAGLNVVAAIEYDKHACATFEANIAKNSKTRLYQSDINDIEPRQVLEECFAEGEPCDIVLGGPPCQGFSTHRLNDAGVDDPRNALIHRYFEFVKEIQPKVFLMENVPGLLWPRHEKVLSALIREAELAGYEILGPVVLDARDYGVPQRRKRVFILGVRSDIAIPSDWVPEPTHIDPKKKLSNDNRLPWVNCADAFKKAPNGDKNKKHMMHSKELVRVFAKTPPNGGSRKQSGRRLACHKDHDGHKDVYGRIDPRHPAPTMTTACINPSKGRFVHPTQHHGITIRQAARIQTFPDQFVFYGGLIASGVQIGNAVPVNLGEVLLRRLVKLLRQQISESEIATSTAALSFSVAAE